MHVAPQWPWDGSGFGRDLFGSFPDHTQLLNSTNCQLIALLFSTIPWSAYCSTDWSNQVFKGPGLGIRSVIEIYSDSVELLPAASFLSSLWYPSQSVCSLVCYCNECVSLLPIAFYSSLHCFLRANLSTLCCKWSQFLWGKRTGAFYFTVCSPSGQNLCTMALELGGWDNGTFLPRHSCCRSWALVGNGAAVASGFTSLSPQAWNLWFMNCKWAGSWIIWTPVFSSCPIQGRACVSGIGIGWKKGVPNLSATLTWNLVSATDN